MSNPFEKILVSERTAARAMRTARDWATDKEVLRSLLRAEYLLAEVRHAAMFLADPAVSEQTKRDAMQRLADAIVNCD